MTPERIDAILNASQPAPRTGLDEARIAALLASPQAQRPVGYQARDYGINALRSVAAIPGLAGDLAGLGRMAWGAVDRAIPETYRNASGVAGTLAQVPGALNKGWAAVADVLPDSGDIQRGFDRLTGYVKPEPKTLAGDVLMNALEFGAGAVGGAGIARGAAQLARKGVIDHKGVLPEFGEQVARRPLSSIGGEVVPAATAGAAYGAVDHLTDDPLLAAAAGLVGGGGAVAGRYMAQDVPASLGHIVNRKGFAERVVADRLQQAAHNPERALQTMTETGAELSGMDRTAYGKRLADFDRAVAQGHDPELLPPLVTAQGGAMPTTAQLADDPGLIGYERGARTRDYAQWADIEDQQRRAKALALAATAPSGNPYQFQNHIEQEYAAIQRHAAARQAAIDHEQSQIAQAKDQVKIDTDYELAQAQQTRAAVAQQGTATITAAQDQQLATRDALNQITENRKAAQRQAERDIAQHSERFRADLEQAQGDIDSAGARLATRMAAKLQPVKEAASAQFAELRQKGRAIPIEITPLRQTATEADQQLGALTGAPKIVRDTQEFALADGGLAVKDSGLSREQAEQSLMRLFQQDDKSAPPKVTAADMMDARRALSRAARDLSRQEGKRPEQRAVLQVQQALDDLLAEQAPDFAKNYQDVRRNWDEQVASRQDRGAAAIFGRGRASDGGKIEPSASIDQMIKADGAGAPETARQLRQIIDNDGEALAALRDGVMDRLARLVKPGEQQIDPYIVELFRKRHSIFLKQFPEIDRDLQKLRNSATAIRTSKRKGMAAQAQFDAEYQAKQGVLQQKARDLHRLRQQTTKDNQAAQAKLALETAHIKDQQTAAHKALHERLKRTQADAGAVQQQLRDYQQSVAGLFLRKDVGNAIKGVLASDNPAQTMRGLYNKVAKNEEALAGLRAAIHEEFRRQATSVVNFATAESTIKGIATLRNVRRKFATILPEVFDKSDIQKLDQFQALLTTLERTQKTTGIHGSQTANNQLMAGLKGKTLPVFTAYFGIIKGRGIATLANVGLDWLGSMIGRTKTAEKIQHLTFAAMTNPNVARTLLMAASKRNEKIIRKRLGSHLALLGYKVVSEQGDQEGEE